MSHFVNYFFYPNFKFDYFVRTRFDESIMSLRTVIFKNRPYHPSVGKTLSRMNLTSKICSLPNLKLVSFFDCYLLLSLVCFIIYLDVLPGFFFNIIYTRCIGPFLIKCTCSFNDCHRHSAKLFSYFWNLTIVHSGIQTNPYLIVLLCGINYWNTFKLNYKFTNKQ